MPFALARAEERGLADMPTPTQVIVIGDTPRDVACARARRCAFPSRSRPAASVVVSSSRRARHVVFADLRDTGRCLSLAGCDLTYLRRFYLRSLLPRNSWRKRLGVEPSLPAQAGSDRF